MNIFYFYDCPIASAQAQPDKMLVKMPLETAQMLCTVWARESASNYRWLYKHFIALGDEYTYRYGKEHASLTKLRDVLKPCPSSLTFDALFGDINITTVAQAMPDQYKDDDPIKAYRNYCINEKTYAKWEKGRNKPKWWNKDVEF